MNVTAIDRLRLQGSNADEWNLFLSEHQDALPYVAVQIATAIESLEKQVYVPGLWRCPKCNFQLVQSYLHAATGAVGMRDTPGEKCPNCDSPLWRVTERQAGNDMVDRCQEQMERAKMLDGVVEKLTLALMKIRCGNGDPVELAREALGLTESPTLEE